MVNLEEKFKKDFGARFGGASMVTNQAKSEMSLLLAMKACSREEISEWIDNWAACNPGMEESVTGIFKFCVGLEFKRAELLEKVEKRIG